MRILAGENIPRVTVDRLRELGHDVKDIRGTAARHRLVVKEISNGLVSARGDSLLQRRPKLDITDRLQATTGIRHQLVKA